MNVDKPAIIKKRLKNVIKKPNLLNYKKTYRDFSWEEAKKE